MSFFPVFLLVVVLINDIKSHKLAGDKCYHEKLLQDGVCKLIIECNSALKNLQQSNLPQLCGFNGTSPIICCPNDPTKNVVGAKSAEKCAEFAKVVVGQKILPVSQTDEHPKDQCGIHLVESILGGGNAKPKQFPHMAEIGYDSTDGEKVYLCTGSLISETFVLTAAHCLNTRQYGYAKYVRLGVVDIKNDHDREMTQEVTIKELIAHPDFRHPIAYNDIGLLRLQNAVKFTEFVRPICLNTEKTLKTEKFIATSWGSTILDGKSNQLQKIIYNYVPRDECATSYVVTRKLNKSIDDDTQLCVRLKNPDNSLCGDSGGALQIYDDVNYCMYKLMGISSFGVRCGLGKIPTVYTRVSHYIDWIEKTVWP